MYIPFQNALAYLFSQGGARFVVFQVIGWTFFAFTILLPWLPWLLAWQYPQEAARVLIIGAGASSIVGEVMMVCSLLTYTRSQPEAPPTKSQFREFLMSRRGYRVWTAFIGMQAMLSIFACTLAALADTFVTMHFARLILMFFAVMCFSLSLFLTYGIGGRWKYYSTEWRFYQPFSGGRRFVVLQALAWAFFSTSMLIFLLHMYDMFCQMTGMQSRIPFHVSFLPSLFASSLCGVLAQVLNAISLFVYKGKLQSPMPHPDECSADASETETVEPTGKSLISWVPSSPANLRQLCFVVMLFNLEKIVGFFMLFSLLFADVAPHTVVTTWVIFGAIYLPTFFGGPSRSGRRNLPGLRGHWFFDDIAAYFRLKLHTVSPLPAEHKYIFGFHPHGILPITCGWIHFTSIWKRMLPGITPASLTSSVIHYVPVMRDVCQFLAGLEVSREGFTQALKLHRSAIFVPGGQREMLESRSEDRDVTIYTAHKGFLRLAMELSAKTDEDVFVVPVYSFGETQILDNLRLPSALQRWCINKLRANVFFFPYGIMGLPGVPRPEHLSIAVGKPVLAPKVASPSSAQVDLLHRRFYTELHHAFEHFKVDAGHGMDTMILTPRVEPLWEDQWKEEWEKCKPVSEPHSHQAAHRHKGHHNEEAWVGLAMMVTFISVVYTAYF